MIDLTEELCRVIEYMDKHFKEPMWMGVTLNEGEPVIAFNVN